jgi:hypothetical protein
VESVINSFKDGVKGKLPRDEFDSLENKIDQQKETQSWQFVMAA